MSPPHSVDRVRVFVWTESAFRCGSVVLSRALKMRMCSKVERVGIFAWTESDFWCESLVSSRALKTDMCSGWPPPLKAPLRGRGGAGWGVFFFNSFFYKDKSRNLSKILLVLLSASVERVGVSRTRETLCNKHLALSLQLSPLGRVGLVLAKSVCLCVFLFVPFPCNLFLRPLIGPQIT